jgi:hypothetical protein
MRGRRRRRSLVPALAIAGGAVLVGAIAVVVGMVIAQPARSSQDDHPATLPLRYVDTAYTLPAGCAPIDVGVSPTGGCKIITVDAGQSLQTALNLARRGDIIQLEANQHFVGPFELPDKGSGTGWVYIVSSALAKLPAAGNRLNPDFGGTCDRKGALPCGVTANASLADLPKIVSGGCAPCRWITTARGADRYRFIGIEFKASPGDYVGSGIRLNENTGHASHAALGDKTSDIIFDRCLMRPDPAAGSNRAVIINGDRHGIINSYLSDWTDDDSDTQAVLVAGYANVFAIVNNYLEATGENVYTDGDETISGKVYVPSDGEIRGNYLKKLADWNTHTPALNQIKNLFEMKSGHRILFEGNIGDTSYHRAQDAAINIKIGNESPNKFTENVTIRNNVIRHVANGLKLCATQCNGPENVKVGNRFAIYNNIFDHVSNATFGRGSDGRCFSLVVTGPTTIFDHNTCISDGDGMTHLSRGHQLAAALRFELTNNIWLYTRDALTTGEVSSVSAAAVYTNNLIVGGSCSSYPRGNRCPSNWADVGFLNYNKGNGGDYTLGPSSPFRGVGSDSYGVGTTDPGANVAAVTAATACVVSGQCPVTAR